MAGDTFTGSIVQATTVIACGDAAWAGACSLTDRSDADGADGMSGGE